ncbi:hypothetical protein TNCT_240311 [Trichonephila clavata]|uniref:Uncharacterized protein n=1 Tax=Trichonephila clavata TaxID=2740835 RepID=A0A8X6I7R7_TRICU|nr:hypothetical protein TNCT_240311 [Trichonephila clavata]
MFKTPFHQQRMSLFAVKPSRTNCRCSCSNNHMKDEQRSTDDPLNTQKKITHLSVLTLPALDQRSGDEFLLLVFPSQPKTSVLASQLTSFV